MLELVLPVAVLAMMLIFVDQVRQLISHAILNRTIRKAMDIDPASAPLLIAKLELRRRWPDVLAGWVLLVGGVALAVAALFETPSDQSETLQVAAFLAILGAGVLIYTWFVHRKTSGS